MSVVSDYTALLAPGGDGFLRWNFGAPLGSPMVITYSFPETSDLPNASELRWGADAAFSFTSSQRADARLAIAEFAKVSGLQFLEVEHGGMLNLFGTNGAAVEGYSDVPVYWSKSGTPVAIESTTSSDFSPGTHAFYTLLHEIGHGLGLKHPFEGTTTLDPALDNSNYSVMSYNRDTASASLGSLDRQALQFLYGAPTDFDNSNVSYNWNETAQLFTMSGSDHDNVLVAVSADSRLVGAGGDDGLYGGPGDDRLSGGYGNDVLSGGYGNDTLYGYDGDDTLEGGNGNNLLYGEQGNDLFILNDGDDTVYGGMGNDTADLTDFYWNYASLTDNARFTSIENLVGGDLDNLFYGDQGGNRLIGQGGNDTLIGRDGNDTLDGGVGKDSLDGGEGRDMASYIGADYGVTVNLADPTANRGQAFGDSLVGIEDIEGSHHSDELTGDNSSNKLLGAGGNDTLIGLDGGDTLEGGHGWDRIWAGPGEDLIFGQIGDDMLNGGDNNDTLWGGGDDDVLNGGSGADSLWGQWGDDVLSGGSGADLLGGSWGADRFDFDAVADSGPDQRDTITDFNAAHADVIDLADIDADWSRSGNEAFQFIGTAEFHNSPGELRFTTAGGDGLLEADNDGDGVANLQIVLLGVTALSGGDIIL